MFIKVNGHTSIFFHHFAKENNFCDFLFASLDGNIFPKWGLILKETANTFLQDPIQKGAIMKKKVNSHKSASIHLTFSSKHHLIWSYKYGMLKYYDHLVIHSTLNTYYDLRLPTKYSLASIYKHEEKAELS